MPTLYITDQQATLGKTHNRLVVERHNVKLAEIHDFKVDRVVIFGNVQVSTQAMAFLLDRGIDTTFLSSHGKLKGRLAPLASKNAFLRVRQYERVRDVRFAAQVASAIVSGKIDNSSEVLARHQRNHPECKLQLELSLLARLSVKAGEKPAIDVLRGIEGQAAAIYFKGFPRMLRRSMDFTKRSGNSYGVRTIFRAQIYRQATPTEWLPPTSVGGGPPSGGPRHSVGVTCL